MKTLNIYINERLNITNNVISERLVLSKNKKNTEYTLFPKSKDELEEMIFNELKENGINVSLNHIDVSEITDLSGLFSSTSINPDISEWDVSNVTNMQDMFYNSDFNGDISEWDVSNVTNMCDMFAHSKFNGDISNWDVSKVTNMNDMFKNCPLRNKPPKWYKN